jgi:Effector-associated domain 11
MLILLADTRKRLLWIWLGFTAVVILLIFIQTLTGKFEGMERKAWLWAFTHLLPALILLFVAVLLNKNQSKVLLKSIFNAVMWGTVVYLVFVLITLFAMPFATINWSIDGYLNKSYLWLLPFQMILLAAFWVLYFKKQLLFRPNPKILQEYVAKKAEFAERTQNTDQQHAFRLLIEDGKMPDLFQYLKTEFQNGNANNTEVNDVLLLESQYHNWQHNNDLNLATPEDLQRELNRQTLAIINVIEKL